MGLSSDTAYQKWRESAQWGTSSEDRYTELWSELVKAAMAAGEGATEFYLGLRRAYSVITGDDESRIQALVKTAVFEKVYSC